MGCRLPTVAVDSDPSDAPAKHLRQQARRRIARPPVSRALPSFPILRRPTGTALFRFRLGVSLECGLRRRRVTTRRLATSTVAESADRDGAGRPAHRARFVDRPLRELVEALVTRFPLYHRRAPESGTPCGRVPDVHSPASGAVPRHADRSDVSLAPRRNLSGRWQSAATSHRPSQWEAATPVVAGDVGFLFSAEQDTISPL